MPVKVSRNPLVIPIFIPHEGCPHHCLFCNQHSITGQAGQAVSADEVAASIAGWLSYANQARRDRVEVAFYGGSFTGLLPARQEALLAAVQPFLDQGLVHGIRLSTRPDYIDVERLALLQRYRVTTVELGVQSCDDAVLHRARRGHVSAAVASAAGLIQEYGFALGIQLMLGLPGERFQSLRRTVTQVIAFKPDFVRLYPVLVLRGSGLETMYHKGGYVPLSLGKAVVCAAWMKKRFDEDGIGVVRMGLQPTRDLMAALVAGPFHPAFGELVKSRLMLQQIRRILATAGQDEQVILQIAEQDRSIFCGQKGANLKRLHELGLAGRFVLRADPHQARSTLRRQSFVH